MIPTMTFLAALLTLAASQHSHVEKVDLSPEELRKTATHVVTVTVSSVYRLEQVVGEGRFRWTTCA